jgi:hypothetical protein
MGSDLHRMISAMPIISGAICLRDCVLLELIRSVAPSRPVEAVV